MGALSLLWKQTASTYNRVLDRPGSLPNAGFLSLVVRSSNYFGAEIEVILQRHAA